MTEPTRSKRRIILGVVALLLGITSLVGFPTTASYYGLGALGVAYGAVMIALGIALILKKETVTN